MSGWDRWADLAYHGYRPNALDYECGRAASANAERNRLAMQALDEQLSAALAKQQQASKIHARLSAVWDNLTPEERLALRIEIVKLLP